ncbi:arylsulfatase [Skermania sp. ID1734]|uniref:arylsulfatase n=1 Tax=Skermania sp. ID1734 TaxID=2597516 RepID=UPI0011803532|nr:arylsulfatase [Skermania sp. ID1734]TSD99685.1 arylsulfatase [Skermania sp. ID1734]
MAQPFRGRIDLDVRNSVPDWGPYEQPKAQAGAPNVVWIVLDDVGFGTFGCYGGPVETPNIDRIAERGLRYSQWHTTALCSPTRAALLTGRNHTTCGMACIAEGSTGFPGSNGHIPPECATLAEVLVDQGYSTAAVGKWHLSPIDETNLAATRRNWPLGRGFERFYGFLGGETSQWYPDLVHDNHSVAQPATPEQGYHFGVDITDKAIEYIDDVKAIAPDRPVFLYYAPGCAHAPHQVPEEWAQRYRGKFDMGYEALREQILARQKELGLVPENTELPPLNPIGSVQDRQGPNGMPFPPLEYTPSWDSLSDDAKRLFGRMAEVFAGFVSHCDAQIGRLLDYLTDIGQLDNTIIVLVSDNGASAEGGPNGSVNENKFFNGVFDSLEENFAQIEELGSTKTYNHYPNGWAMAFCTPFKMWKRYSFNGGTCDPCIISWPAGIEAHGEVRDQYHHAVDVMPTVLDCLGLDLPETVRGVVQRPLQGSSMRYSFDNDGIPTAKHTQFYSMLGTRGIWHDGWKAVTTHPALSGWSNFDADVWELYHTDVDRAELHDLAEQEPTRLAQLIGLWFHEAGVNQALPIDDRSPIEIMFSPRPFMVEPRNRYIYRPGGASVPETMSVSVRNRSYSIAAVIEDAGPDQNGVLFAQGSRFGGHALYVANHRLHYVYNFLGSVQQLVSADEDVPVGDEIVLAAAFVKDGENPPGTASGVLSLYYGDHKVGEGRIKTQPGAYGLGAVGLTAGRGGPDAVGDGFVGEAPWHYTGGTLNRLVVDVSGQPYVDLEREAAAMLARE